MLLDISKLFFTPSLTAIRNMDILINRPIVKTAYSVPMFAYLLATVYHETGITKKLPSGKKVTYRDMAPVDEVGKGKGKLYGRPNAKGLIYYGRGQIQLTWEDKYRKAGQFLGIDLVNNPDEALDEIVSADIATLGMLNGWFTSRRLSHYIGNGKVDYLNARRIINGMDKAELIKEYAEKFALALTL